jgi:hypothetical protein
MFICAGIGIEIKCEENQSLEHRSALEQLADKIDQLEIVLNKVIVNYPLWNKYLINLVKDDSFKIITNNNSDNYYV